MGSREYQFNRLLVEVDNLIENKFITEEVFAQIGSSDYIPKHYLYKRFLSPEEFTSYQSRASLIISHGGTGALISGIKMGKKVIAVPRMSRFSEHSDDHQMEISQTLYDKGMIVSYVTDIKTLKNSIFSSKNFKIVNFKLESRVESLVTEFIFNNRK